MKKRQIDRNNITSFIGEGSESKVYGYKDGDHYVVLKEFKKEFKTPTKTEKIPKEVFKNKERKLLLISQSDLFQKDEKPIDFFYDENGDFVAYSMFYFGNPTIDSYYTASTKETVKVLDSYRKRMEELNRHGIYLGDMNLDNIGIRNDGSIRLGDIDNISIGGLPFDRETNLVKEYKKRCSKIDNVDNYSFNILSMALLSGTDFVKVQRHIDASELPKRFNNDVNKQIIEELKSISDNYEPKYIMDNKNDSLGTKIKKGFRH